MAVLPTNYAFHRDGPGFTGPDGTHYEAEGDLFYALYHDFDGAALSEGEWEELGALFRGIPRFLKAEDEYRLAEYYEHRKNDKSKSAFWYSKAAEQGHNMAMFRAGAAYKEIGKVGEAIKWLDSYFQTQFFTREGQAAGEMLKELRPGKKEGSNTPFFKLNESSEEEFDEVPPLGEGEVYFEDLTPHIKVDGKLVPREHDADEFDEIQALALQGDTHAAYLLGMAYWLNVKAVQEFELPDSERKSEAEYYFQIAGKSPSDKKEDQFIAGAFLRSCEDEISDSEDPSVGESGDPWQKSSEKMSGSEGQGSDDLSLLRAPIALRQNTPPAWKQSISDRRFSVMRQ